MDDINEISVMPLSVDEDIEQFGEGLESKSQGSDLRNGFEVKKKKKKRKMKMHMWAFKGRNGVKADVIMTPMQKKQNNVNHNRKELNESWL